jgi:hypothetical protein
MVGTPGYPDLSAVVEQLGALHEVDASAVGAALRRSVEEFVGRTL